MSMPDPADVAERLLELMTAIDQIRDIRLERARTAEEREKAIADHAAVLRTVTALVDDIQEQDNEQPVI